MSRSSGIMLASLLFSLAAFGQVSSEASPVKGGWVKGGLEERGSSRAQLNANCDTSKSSVTASDLLNSSTTSTTYVDVPEATVSFKQKGTKPGCVVVDFFAVAFAPFDAALFVHVLLDGVEIFPGPGQFSGDDDEDVDTHWSRAQAFSWIAPDVAPGNHTVQVQFRSYFGTDVFIHKHITIVHHR